MLSCLCCPEGKLGVGVRGKSLGLKPDSCFVSFNRDFYLCFRSEQGLEIFPRNVCPKNSSKATMEGF